MKIFLITLLSLSFSYASKAQFIENKGQWPAEVLYMCSLKDVDCWILKDGVTYNFHIAESSSNETQKIPSTRFQRPATIAGHVITARFPNSNPDISYTGNIKRKEYYNYFLGKDKTKWATNVSLYNEVIIRGIYPHTDLLYYFENGLLRYDFILNPGADISSIKLNLEGAINSYIESPDKFVFETRFGQVAQTGLFAYQQINNNIEKANCQFVKYIDGTIGFDAEWPNRQQPLIIDPLIYATFTGGWNIEFPRSLKVDEAGNSYITGSTNSYDYPVTPGAYNTVFAGNVFVSKMNNQGNALVYSTFVGGDAIDISFSLALGSDNNVYVTGYTGHEATDPSDTANNFPITQGAFESVYHFQFDAFAFKLSSGGDDLLYSTYLGGSRWETGTAITVDNANAAYVTGITISPDFPTTGNAFSQNFNDTSTNPTYIEEDAFIVKLDASGSTLQYATYLGGNGGDRPNAITVDSLGNAYVTGETYSFDFPITPDAFCDTIHSVPLPLETLADVFVAKLNSSGSALIYSTYIGGQDLDAGTSILLDDDLNMYIAGYTGFGGYGGFPLLANSYNVPYTASDDFFVLKLNSSGSALIFSGILGGLGDDKLTGMAFDKHKYIYLTGFSSYIDFPLTNNAAQQYSGMYDAVIVKINAAGDTMLYSSYLGGISSDFATGIATDTAGYTYVTGVSASADFPVTTGCFDNTYNGGDVSAAWDMLYHSGPADGDAFIVKMLIEDSAYTNHVTPTSKNYSFDIFPNPSTGDLSIKSSVKGCVYLYDINGTVLGKYLLHSGTTHITLPKMAAGIYALKLINSNGSFTTKRLMYQP